MNEIYDLMKRGFKQLVEDVQTACGLVKLSGERLDTMIILLKTVTENERQILGLLEILIRQTEAIDDINGHAAVCQGEFHRLINYLKTGKAEI